MFFNTLALRKNFGLILFVVCISSCKSSPEELSGEMSNEKTAYSLALSKKDTSTLKKFDDYFSGSRIISLKVKDSSAFVASIDKIILYQNKIFLLDKRFSSLISFDQSGHYMTKYGEIGLGPNQFKGISDFDIDSSNNRVVIFSNENRSLYYYALSDGSFLKKKKIGLFGTAISTLNDNKILLYKNYTTNDPGGNYNIVLLDSNANILKRGAMFNSKTSTMTWPFTGFLTKSNRNIFCTPAFSDTIFKFENERLSPYVSVGINSANIKEEGANHKKLFYSKILFDTSTRFLVNCFLKNEDYMVLRYQSEKRLKTGIYNIKKDSIVVLTSKVQEDPLLSLIKTPLYLGPDNTIVFLVSRETILDQKTKHPELLSKLSPENRSTIDSVGEMSGDLLLVSKIR